MIASVRKKVRLQPLTVSVDEWSRLQRIAEIAPKHFPGGDGAWLAGLVALMPAVKRPSSTWYAVRSFIAYCEGRSG